MKLQLALDLTDIDEAAKLAESLASEVDQIEVGTPLLLRHGMRAVRTLRRLLPHATLIADCKTMDCGQVVAAMAAEAGADGLIVQAAAPAATLTAALREARVSGLFVMVDDLGVEPSDLARRLSDVEIDAVVLHVGKDDQHTGLHAGLRTRTSEVVGLAPIIALAGGISSENIGSVRTIPGIDVFIVGEGLYKASDPVRVARSMRSECHLRKAG